MQPIELNEEQLLTYLQNTETNNRCGGHPDFREWNNETPELKSKLIKIGQVADSIQPDADQYNFPYWGENTPVLLTKYPYYGCDLLQCCACNAVFFYYLELGGHGAQKRYRMLRKELFEK